MDVAIIDAPLTSRAYGTCDKGDPSRTLALDLFDGIDFIVSLKFNASSTKYKLKTVGSVYTVVPQLFKNPLVRKYNV